ncbi:ParB N-terminal domain-containing protein [Streptomyces lunaelactis]|uniref:ParB/RepB/Spo0J family partition protein n=1 Tax=Streptomyces lunaelactis TaxID=1535768 RepID=UPI001584D27D|nr:ParB N-terminal domain-containing protein [Streptomyces lunaelactis]NUK51367.1 ParB N-terminal domain-containing protein [Streptomyces lunaelactis]NUK63247.1 ParB N-terminal domain-containing protein [Streptomyces lunaelactis]
MSVDLAGPVDRIQPSPADPASAAEAAEAAAAGESGESGGSNPGRQATVALGSLLPSDSPRVHGESDEHVQVLAELDSPLPPILVHRETMRVIDGMHRLRAARLRGDKNIDVEFFDGAAEDAFALAVKLNVAHGLPLSQADRTAAATRIVAARPHWSDRRIASNTGLAAGTIAAIRRRSTAQSEQLNARTGRDGRVRPLHGTEGRLRASQVIAAHPDASLREIAERAGIAAATAKDVRDRIRQGQDPVPSRARTAVAQQAPRGAEAPARTPAGRGTTRTSAAAIGLILPNMRKDPSLRTEAGRVLLQLLSLHSIGDEAKWRRLAQSVPGHRAAVLAQAARRCADHWLRLAHELEMRCP